MILGVGTDIIEVDRIRATLERYGEQFEQRVFNPEEIAYCRRTPRRTAERYAARFAAKEAMSKALGTGISMGTRWRDMEVRKLPTGKPWMQLHGRLAQRCADCRVELTLTHTEALAMATVILERR